MLNDASSERTSERVQLTCFRDVFFSLPSRSSTDYLSSPYPALHLESSVIVYMEPINKRFMLSFEGRWHSVVVSALSTIKVVNRHWARLLLGWVTACRQVKHLGTCHAVAKISQIYCQVF